MKVVSLMATLWTGLLVSVAFVPASTLVAQDLAPPELAQRSPWGLRNLEFTTWPDPVTIFQNHAAGHLALWLLWKELEPTQGALDWSTLDTRLGIALRLDTTPVILLHLGPAWAMSSSFGGPMDLDRTISLRLPTPPRGYSETLYTITQALVNKLVQKSPGLVYLRFQNEPYTEWFTGTEGEWQDNIDNFERCLRTFRKAARDVEAQNSNAIQIRISHGSLQRVRLVERTLYEYGQKKPAKQKTLLPIFQSYHERRTGLAFTNWADLENWASTTGSQGKADRRADLGLAGFACKWASCLKENLLGFCTPAVGAPPANYFGLYADWSLTTPYLSNTSFVFLANLLRP